MKPYEKPAVRELDELEVRQKEACVSEKERVESGRWSCVVAAGQVWVSPLGKSYRAAEVELASAEATVRLDPIHGGERLALSASYLCRGDSGWTRLPDPPPPPPPRRLPRVNDDGDDDTVCFDKTIVGTPRAPP